MEWRCLDESARDEILIRRNPSNAERCVMKEYVVKRIVGAFIWFAVGYIFYKIGR